MLSVDSLNFFLHVTRENEHLLLITLNDVDSNNAKTKTIGLHMQTEFHHVCSCQKIELIIFKSYLIGLALCRQACIR